MAKRRVKPDLPMRGTDSGPAERYQHGDIIRSEPGAAAGVFHKRVTTQTALDRYRVREHISQRQFDAGTKLYRMWRAAGGGQRVIASYGMRLQAQPELSDEQAQLRHRVSQVLRRMGPLSGILVHCCICDEAARGWAAARGDAPQSGLAMLRLALDGLADYWRL